MQYPGLVAKWQRAAGILGFDVVSPYSVAVPSGAVIDAPLLVEGFGAKIGMIIVTEYSQVEHCWRELAEAGYGFSVFEEPRPSEPFDVDVFVEILRDWGWAGKLEDQPSWLAESIDHGAVEGPDDD